MELSFSLKEIAEWNKSGSKVMIPDLQRGLVWSPKQIEFLWDSILRSFPIGGFVLSKNADDTFFLLDGQQRFNAISLGFQKLSEESDAALWFDIDPDKSIYSTRKFFIKATTVAHPWGFNNDDNCSILSAEDMRIAIKKIWPDEEIDIYKESISLVSAFPDKANFPIPLYVFLSANNLNKTIFKTDVITAIENLSPNWKRLFWTKEKKTFLNNNFDNLYILFSRINNYTIASNKIDLKIMEEEQEVIESSESDHLYSQTNLELLFTRLNTFGTAITQEDLYYSAIKAYWGGIKKDIEEIAEDRISPVRLISTLFRLDLTIRDRKKEKFSDRLTITRIRRLAKNETDKNHIEEFIKTNAKALVIKVDKQLEDIPKYLKTKIISDTEDIYLLLLYLAYKNISVDYSGLALYLYFFATKSNINKCVNEILSNIKKVTNKNQQEYEHMIRKSFSRLYAEDLMWKVESPKLFKAEDLFNYMQAWYWQIKPAWFDFWDYISTDKDFLIYAQKDFLNEEFPLYNPANLKACEGYNRPWDYDHIIPFSWSYNKKGQYKKEIVDKWIGRNGNFAAIPYSENRSKSDSDNWNYYDKHRVQLLFDPSFKKIEDNITWDSEMATEFATIVYKRCLRIYKKLYFRIKNFIPLVQDFSDEVKKRKNFFNNLKNKFPVPGFKKYDMRLFFCDNSNSLDYDIENDNDWNSNCITYGIPIDKDNYMIAFSWTIIDKDNQQYMIGIRGRKNNGNLKRRFNNFITKYQDEGFYSVDNYWWFRKDFDSQKKPRTDEVLKILRLLITEFKDKV